jgi:hypothetical protein
VAVLVTGTLSVAGANPVAHDTPSPAFSTITLSNDPAVLTGQPGSGSFTATVTFDDASGDPVSGEQVIMVVEDTTTSENMTTLVPNNGQEFTDSDGQVSYPMSCASLGCHPGDRLQISAADGSEDIEAGPVTESVGEVTFAVATGYVGQSNTLIVEDLTGAPTEDKPVSLSLAGTAVTLPSCTTDGTGSLPAAGSSGACSFTVPALGGASPPQSIDAQITVGAQVFDASLLLLAGQSSNATSTISVSPDPMVLSSPGGSASFTVTVDVEDASGSPIAGDPVSLATDPNFGGEAVTSPQTTGGSGVATFVWTCPSGYCEPGQVISVSATDADGLSLGPVDEDVSEIEFSGAGYTGATDTLVVEDLPGAAAEDQPVSLSLDGSPVALTGTCTTSGTGSLPSPAGTDPCTFTVPAISGATPPESVPAVITVGTDVLDQTFTLEPAPALELSPTSGPGGTTITVDGTALSPDDSVDIGFTPFGATTSSVSTECSTDGDGNIINNADTTCQLTIPAESPVGAGAVATQGFAGATATFTVEAPVMTGIDISSAGFTTTPGVPGVEIYVGDTDNLQIEADYSNGTASPLVVPPGDPEPVVSMSIDSDPSGAITFGYTGGDLIPVTANAVTTSPAVIEATYDGFAPAYSDSLNGAVQPCHDCYFVNGALLTVQAQTPGALGIGSTPLAGATADITQGVDEPGAYTVDEPCYPFSSNDEEGCGSPPTGDPATASTSTCTTDDTGSCPLTAMWDPDTVSLTPPLGYTITGVTGCGSVTGPADAPVCDLTPADWSNPLTITFQLLPLPSLVALVSGTNVSGGISDGSTVTLTPDGVSEPSWWAASDQGTWPPTCTTTTAVGDDSGCAFDVLPTGSFSVGIDLSTAGATATYPLYAVGTDSQQADQSVTLNPGDKATVPFQVGFAPSLVALVSGTNVSGGISDGSTVTLTPNGVSEPSWWAASDQGTWPPTCTTTTAVGDDSGCAFDDLPPGSFSVGIDLSTAGATATYPLYAVGTDTQQADQSVTVNPGDKATVPFQVAQAPGLNVTVSGVNDTDSAGTTIKIIPEGGQAEPGWWADSNQGAWPPECTTTSLAGDESWCSYTSLPPGTWTVSIDASTAAGSTAIPDAVPIYVSGTNSQTGVQNDVDLTPGVNRGTNFTVAQAPGLNVTVSGVSDTDSAGTTIEIIPESGQTEPDWWADSNQGAWPPECTTTSLSGDESWCSYTSLPPGTWAASIDTSTAAYADVLPLYVSGTDFDTGVQNGIDLAAGINSGTDFEVAPPPVTSMASGPSTATDGAVTATASGGTGSVTVGEYGGDPQSALAFVSGSNYSDVYLPPGNTFTGLTFTECGLTSHSSMGWWNPVGDGGALGSWEPVTGDPGPTYANGCLTVTLNALTSPSLAQLDGTVFGAGLPAPPTPTVTSPASGAVYVLGQSVSTRFTCRDSALGPGISSCTDSDGSTRGTGALPTSSLGAFTYSVTAVSKDGETSTTKVHYSVVPSPSSGYDLVGRDGGVFVFPTGQSGGFYGSLPGLGIHVDDIVGMVPTANDHGYFVVGSDGGVFAFGDAPFENSLPGIGVQVNDIVGIVPTADDKGYFVVGSDGGVFTFGDAPYLGSLPGIGVHVTDIVGIAADPTDTGYWLVEANGTVHAFGTAANFASAAGTSSPVSTIESTPDGGGYWIVTQNGSVDAFGDARFSGSLPGIGVIPSRPVIGLVPTSDDGGYWLIGSDGGVFAFGDAPFVGSLPGLGASVTDIVGAVPTHPSSA